MDYDEKLQLAYKAVSDYIMSLSPNDFYKSNQYCHKKEYILAQHDGVIGDIQIEVMYCPKLLVSHVLHVLLYDPQNGNEYWLKFRNGSPCLKHVMNMKKKFKSCWKTQEELDNLQQLAELTEKIL